MQEMPSYFFSTERQRSSSSPGSIDVRHVAPSFPSGYTFSLTRRPAGFSTGVGCHSRETVFSLAASPASKAIAPCGRSTALTTGAPWATVGGDGARRSEAAPSLSDDLDGAISCSDTAGPEGDAVKNDDTPGDE